MWTPVQRTMFFLKPMIERGDERMRQVKLESEIRLGIFQSGFKRIAHFSYNLNADDLLTIYPDMPTELWKATRLHLLDAEVTVVLLEGEPGIIDRLADYAGREVEPARCAAHTVRYRYGSRTPKELKGGLVYWENVIHCPKSLEEAARDIKLFFPG